MASLDLERQQKEVCRRFGTTWFGCSPDLKVGISQNVNTGTFPLNGFREPPSGGTAGGSISRGAVPSTAPNFFPTPHEVRLITQGAGVLHYLVSALSSRAVLSIPKTAIRC